MSLLILAQGGLPPVGIALVIVLLIVSLGIHEAAHGWVALKCGDPTARDLGRITLNPLVHIDPFLTIILPLMLFLTVGVMFGGAKPVPVNFWGLRKPYRDMALVALAGPATNFLLAIFFGFLLHLLVDVLAVWPRDALGPDVLAWAMYLNLLLTVFNLLPIPPLDGSRVMTWLLPKQMRPAFASLDRFGLILVMGFLYFVPWTRTIMWEGLSVLSDAVHGIVTLGGAW